MGKECHDQSSLGNVGLSILKELTPSRTFPGFFTSFLVAAVANCHKRGDLQSLMVLEPRSLKAVSLS